MQNIISEIRKRQDELIVMVNSTFEAIIKEVQQINQNLTEEENEYELIYPITNTAGFKGKKSLAVILNGERIVAPTWKTVFKIILEDAISDEKTLNKINNLRDRLLGRVRTRLSSKPDDMRSPLKLSDDLYVETHYDTKMLMNFLLQILDEISYDYSSINIVIKN